MGERGPAPKRDAQRRRKNKPAVPTQKVVAEGKVEIPAPSEEWDPIAKDWYASLRTSGQSRYFEPSDWQAARYVAEAMTKNLNAKQFSAVLFAAVWSALGELLTTEGARRRVRMEVERVASADPDEDAAVAALDDYRKRLA